MPNVTAAEVIDKELIEILLRRDNLIHFKKASSNNSDESTAATTDEANQHRAVDTDDLRRKIEEDIKAQRLAKTDTSNPNLHADARLTHSRLDMLEAHTVGLAFSGGGIRSGTFAVGFLQGLAQLRLLSRFDYLSTVSGGGYAGAWLAAWLKREGNVEDVEQQLDPSRVRNAWADRVLLKKGQVIDEEPEPLFHLREYSSYLTPTPGLTTADTWTLFAIWLRNVAINLMVLLPMATILVLLARIIVSLYIKFNPSSFPSVDLMPNWVPVTLFGCGLALYLWAFDKNSLALREFRDESSDTTDIIHGKTLKRTDLIEKKILVWVGSMTTAILLATIPLRHVIWLIGSYVAGATGGVRWTSNAVINSLSDYVSGNLDLLGLPNVLGHGLVFGILMVIGACMRHRRGWTFAAITTSALIATIAGLARPEGLSLGLTIATILAGLLSLATLALVVAYLAAGLNRPWGAYIGSAFVAGVTGGVLLATLEALIRFLENANFHGLTATLVPPLGVMIYVAAITVEVALLSQHANEAEREWWARLSGLLMIGAFSWLTAMSTILYIPALFLWAGPLAKTALASGWLGTTVLGILAGRRTSMGQASRKGGKTTLDWLAVIMPPIFLIGLLGAVALLVSYLVNMPPLAIPQLGDDWTAVERYAKGVAGTSLQVLLAYLIGTVILYWIANRTIDVNLFSLHAMYANRLIRCYIGASRPKPRWQTRWGGLHAPDRGGGAPALHGNPEPPAPASDPEALALERETHSGEPSARQQTRPPSREIANLYARIATFKKALNDLEQKIDHLSRRRTATPGASDDIGRQIKEATRERYWKTRLLLKAYDQLASLDGENREQIELERYRQETKLVFWRTEQYPSDQNPVTGFDLRDDIPLFDLRIGRPSKNGGVYWGPHLLINCALNLVAGRELAWRDRKAESFLISPLHCGSKKVGYANVTAATSDNLTLGRAITISGAAIDPNMSFYQSPALTALLTIFNARLGYWMQNPRFAGWKGDGPRFGDRLAAELLGQTSDQDDFVHLSDGGHFENLGIYELVRRRCRYIVAVDAGEDIDASNENLANLVRLCRIDFGVRVELDTEPLTQGTNGLSRTHVVVGRIHYEDVDSGQVPGTIVYIKISMTGDEPSDVQKYASKDPRFPHQPTDFRQSFNEEQFESYRALGDHIARDVFSNAVAKMARSEFREEWLRPNDRTTYIRGNQRFFSALRNRWASPPADHDEKYLSSCKDWCDLQRQLRTEPALTDLSRDLYPELKNLLEPQPQPHSPINNSTHYRAELHAVGQMLQIMENAWIGLGLKGHYDMPIDRGWMNIFRRWTATRAFQRSWPILRPEFSPDFVTFCESQLQPGSTPPPWTIRLTNDFDLVYPKSFEARSLALLNEEFLREWPEEGIESNGRPARDLYALIKRSRTLSHPLGAASDNHLACWLIVQALPKNKPDANTDDKFACGIILVCSSPEIIPTSMRKSVTLNEKKFDASNTLEFFAWVRRSHRSTGLGSRCIRPILRQIDDTIESKKTLVVRYPKPEREVDRNIEMAMWKSFFSLYDFKPPSKGDTDRLSDEVNQTILYHEIGNNAPKVNA